MTSTSTPRTTDRRNSSRAALRQALTTGVADAERYRLADQLDRAVGASSFFPPLLPLELAGGSLGDRKRLLHDWLLRAGIPTDLVTQIADKLHPKVNYVNFRAVSGGGHALIVERASN